MQRGRRILTAIAVIMSLVLLAGCASSKNSASGANTLDGGVKIPSSGGNQPVSTTVNVTLGDTAGLGGSMTLTVSPSTVPSGDVTFVVKNNGTIEHEAVVLKTSTEFDKLPITYGGDPPVPVAKGANKVSEDANVGETGDPNLKPGDTRTFTIKSMVVGNYAVVCNIAQHYGKGMRAGLTVTDPARTVNVALGDSGAAGPMTLSLSPSSVPAGDVTFVVKNNGTIEHEAVVLKTSVPFDKLPITFGGDPPARVTSGANKVDEATNIGETGDPNLKPGDTRTFTIKHMVAGSYAVVCNIAEHYGKGMRAALTVTNPTSTVNVALGDSGAAGPMTLSLSPSSVPAGDVTFVVKNNGTIEHEAVVLKTSTEFDKLPITFGGDPPARVTSGANKVDEATNIGETGDPNLKPGDTRTFTIKNMVAGDYSVVCNIAGHYGKGMRAGLTVTDPARTVNVALGDSGAAGPMTLTVSPGTVPAGDVTFVVKNNGTIEHEAVVLKTSTEFDKLPITFGGDPPARVTSGANKVDEATNIGETGDPNLKPGDTRTFTIKNMVAGDYSVVCNIAEHYGKGMRAPLKVG